MSEEKRTAPLEERRKELTEMAYLLAEALNEGRVSEGQERLPNEEVDRLVRKFVEGKLASEAAARQNRQD